MPPWMQRIVDFYNSDTGRRLAKWLTVVLGGLIQSGAIPGDMPIGLGLSLGQVLTWTGLAIPSGQLNVRTATGDLTTAGRRAIDR